VHAATPRAATERRGGGTLPLPLPLPPDGATATSSPYSQTLRITLIFSVLPYLQKYGNTEPYKTRAHPLSRSIQAGGKSYAITLPIETLRAFDWEVHQKLKLTVDQKTKRVIVEEAKP
jgi:hypothetical protein